MESSTLWASATFVVPPVGVATTFERPETPTSRGALRLIY